MEYLLAVLVMGSLIVFLGGLWWLARQLKPTATNSGLNLLQQDLLSLNQQVGQLTQHLGTKIDQNNLAVQASLSQQLEQSAKLIAEVSTRLTQLGETNKRVISVADELKTLQAVLQNPKQRGVFGEYYLQTVLDNVLPPGQFQLQYHFADGKIADAVIFLDQNKILPIDAKFSLENYNRYTQAATKTERERYLALVRTDLKKRIDETSKYIQPTQQTMDFAIMFIPSEAIYYDLLVSGVGEAGHARDLLEYAFRDKKVIIASPTTFLAYLQTVLQGLRSLQIEREAQAIQKRVQDLGRHLQQYDHYWRKLGQALSTTVGHYNHASKELVKVDRDVIKIAGGTPTSAVETVAKPQLETDLT
jgi:DNA recombination protein RmuC